MSGKTIEVINTDAEGRLILADAMSYARQLGLHAPGGRRHAHRRRGGGSRPPERGLFANDDAMRDRVLQAAKREGEKMWHMPLEDDYKDYLKSVFRRSRRTWAGAGAARSPRRCS